MAASSRSRTWSLPGWARTVLHSMAWSPHGPAGAQSRSFVLLSPHVGAGGGEEKRGAGGALRGILAPRPVLAFPRMNYYRALQRKEDGRWDFTRTNDRVSTPTGYCAGWIEWTPEQIERIPELVRETARLEPFRHKFHTDGHATREEAVACYRRYELDTSTNLDGRTVNASRCLVCGEWTDRFASVSQCSHFPLCDKHRTAEEVEKRYEGSDSVASSW